MPDSDTHRAALRADCTRCFGLCCVVPGFVASADFAITKLPEKPCRHLRTDFGCGIHDRLRSDGFPGCTVYDCLGAGQKIAQVTFGGTDWRSDRRIAAAMFASFPVMRHLHEFLWYLTDAMALPGADALREELAAALDETERISRLAADELVRLDLTDHGRDVNALLDHASRLARVGTRHPDLDHRGADLVGRSLRDADLSGAALGGALLIGADLRGADLSRADVMGADFRGANLHGADLVDTIYLIQSQLDAANGDAATKIDETLRRPGHWSPSRPGARPRPASSPPGRRHTGRIARRLG